MCASFAVRPRRAQSLHTSQGAVRSILHGSARFKVQCSPSLRPPSYGVPYMPLRYRRPRRFAALCDRPECSRLAPFSHRGPRTWLSLSSSLTGGGGVRSLVGPAFGHRGHAAHRSRPLRDYRCVYGAANSANRVCVIGGHGTAGMTGGLGEWLSHGAWAGTPPPLPLLAWPAGGADRALGECGACRGRCAPNWEVRSGQTWNTGSGDRIAFLWLSGSLAGLKVRLNRISALWAQGSKPSRVNHTGQRTFTATRNVRCLLTLAAAAARCPLCALSSMHAARCLVRPLTGALNPARCLLRVASLL